MLIRLIFYQNVEVVAHHAVSYDADSTKIRNPPDLLTQLLARPPIEKMLLIHRMAHAMVNRTPRPDLQPPSHYESTLDTRSISVKNNQVGLLSLVRDLPVCFCAGRCGSIVDHCYSLN